MSSDIHLEEKMNTSLKYLDINLGHTYRNILLINDQVREYQTIVDSVNANTFPIVYSPNSSKTEILTLLQTKFTGIDRIGLCFTSTIGTPEQLFLDNQPFLRIDKNITSTQNTNTDPSTNTNFVSENSNQDDGMIIDIISDSSMNINMNIPTPAISTISYAIPDISLNYIPDISLKSTADLSLNIIYDQNLNEYSENFDFLVQIITDFQVKNIDFLACNTLLSPEWNIYYDMLSQLTNVIIGASEDKTGNLKYGGDWVMESTMEDIETVYFTQKIEYYNYLFDTITITSLTGSTMELLGGNTYNLGNNITVSTNFYFTFADPYVIFDGQGFTVTINNVTNFNGLFRNGTSNAKWSRQYHHTEPGCINERFNNIIHRRGMGMSIVFWKRCG